MNCVIVELIEDGDYGGYGGAWVPRLDIGKVYGPYTSIQQAEAALKTLPLSDYHIRELS